MNTKDDVAIEAYYIWSILSEVGNSPYLIRKKITGFDIRYSDNSIVIPIRDIKGDLWNLLTIYEDGKKKFLSGSRIKGCFGTIGVIMDGNPIYIVEGYSTGATIHMATNESVVVVVALCASNLLEVISELNKHYPSCSLIIAGDDDQWNKINDGRRSAEKAAMIYDCKVVFPKFINTETKPTDWNDLHCLEGLDEVKNQLIIHS